MSDVQPGEQSHWDNETAAIDAIIDRLGASACKRCQMIFMLATIIHQVGQVEGYTGEPLMDGELRAWAEREIAERLQGCPGPDPNSLADLTPNGQFTCVCRSPIVYLSPLEPDQS